MIKIAIEIDTHWPRFVRVLLCKIGLHDWRYGNLCLRGWCNQTRRRLHR